jgi:tetratricopeptide (TPR) repeat protein
VGALLEKLWPLFKQWKTRKGYCIISLVSLVLVFYSKIVFFVWGLVSYGCFILLWTILWYFLSGRYIFPSQNKKTVVLCFNVDAEVQKNQKRIFQALQQRLDDLNLTKKIRLREIAPDIIKNKSQAYKYREKTFVDLVVWGQSIFGTIDSRKTAQYKVYHTCKITDALQPKVQQFIADVGLILLKRKWEISETNELYDIRILAENIFETCLFIIGIYFYSENYFADAAKVFETILPSLDAKGNQTQLEECKLQAGRVRLFLVEIYIIQARIAHDNKKYPEAISIFEKILPIVPNKITVWIMLATSYYFNGDLPSAQQYTDYIREIDKEHPAVCFNNAFFAILQKNYEQTKYWYDILVRMKEIRDVDPFYVITFLDEEYKKNPSEHAYQYGLAIVNGSMDVSIRRRELNRFIRLVKNRPEYDVLTKRAKELLCSWN